MDTLNFHYATSLFPQNPIDQKFWNPAISWQNKYSNVDTLTPLFPGSTTIFTFLTDGWHLFQFLFLNLFIAAIIFYTPIISCQWDLIIPKNILNKVLDFITIGITFRLGFTIFYNFILPRPKT